MWQRCDVLEIVLGLPHCQERAAKWRPACSKRKGSCLTLSDISDSAGSGNANLGVVFGMRLGKEAAEMEASHY